MFNTFILNQHNVAEKANIKNVWEKTFQDMTSNHFPLSNTKVGSKKKFFGKIML